MNRVGQPLTAHYFNHRAADVAEEKTRLLEIQVGGKTLHFSTGAGVFSRRDLDDGSRLLLQTVALEEGARVLDLGCGWGAVGCFLAARDLSAQVVMTDINATAVTLAKRNAQANELQNIAALCGDGALALCSNSFDAVLCNPPVRAGNAVIAQLFDDAFRVLRNGGALWIVLRTAQGAKSWQKKLKTQFGNCQTIAIDGGYRILKSVKNQLPEGTS